MLVIGGVSALMRVRVRREALARIIQGGTHMRTCKATHAETTLPPGRRTTPAAVKKDLRRRGRRYIYVYIRAALYVRFIYLHICVKRGGEE